jgi:DNA-binding transcriptional LysR family regulator
MTRAAEELHMTQPALSRAISNLEQELGTPLFEREGKNLQLNEHGKIVQASARRIFEELDGMQERLNDTMDGISGTLRIGSSFPNREPDYIQMCIVEFMNRYPNVAISYVQHSPNLLLEDLREREIDIAITSIPMHYVDVSWQEVFSEPLGLLLSSNHPLASCEEIEIDQLRYERFYCNNSNSDTQDLTLEFCHQAGFEPQIFFQGFFPEVIGQAISQGKGVSFLVKSRYILDQQSSAHYDWSKNLIFRPIKEDYCKRTCGIAYMKRNYHSKAMRTFYEFFLDFFQEIYEKEA